MDVGERIGYEGGCTSRTEAQSPDANLRGAQLGGSDSMPVGRGAVWECGRVEVESPVGRDNGRAMDCILMFSVAEAFMLETFRLGCRVSVIMMELRERPRLTRVELVTTSRHAANRTLNILNVYLNIFRVSIAPVNPIYSPDTTSNSHRTLLHFPLSGEASMLLPCSIPTPHV